MSKVVPLNAPRPTPADPYMQFCLARRDLNQAFAAWLATSPARDDVRVELDGTEAALRQLFDLARAS